MKIKMKKKAKGFTLVELIVVMIILAILAGLIVPSMTGYIDKAASQAVATEAKGIYTAAQATLTEYYALYPSYSTKMSCNDGKGKVYGRVTNYMLYSVQRKANNITPDQNVDAAIAKQVLAYLDSSDYATATYKMEKQVNPLNTNVIAYQKANNGQPAINICYDNHGRIAFVEFGRDGYYAHVTKDSVEVFDCSDPSVKMSKYPN